MRYDQRTKQLLEWLGLSEGGLVDHPNDPGGRTNKGVTQRVYSAWRRRNNMTAQPVDAITTAEADAIFVEQYFEPVRYRDLPLGLDYTVVDFAVNSGVSRAAKYLQAACNKVGNAGIGVDGIIGNVTLDAVAEIASTPGRGVTALIDEVNDERLAFMKRARNPKTGKSLWHTFGRGWSRRVDGVRTQSKLDAMGRKTVETYVPADSVKADVEEHRTWLQKLLWPRQ